jgi:glycosyltransferase involved in cell wall biosynthesis
MLRIRQMRESDLAFITYEGPWFRAGGIAAVMKHLPCATQAVSRLPVIVITPFHESPLDLNEIPKLPLQEIGVLALPYDGDSIRVRVLHVNAGCPWYFLRVEGAPASRVAFFGGSRHPYDVPKDVLLRDSLFFGVAAVEALRTVAEHQRIDPEKAEWNLIAQDWEAATSLLTFAGQQQSRGRLHLVLHNSYDTFASTADLARAGIDPAHCPGDTILHRALSIIEQPAFTVSDQFARDFTEDVLQCDVMAPQLQALLKRTPVIGVDNGPFTRLEVDQAHLRGAAIGEFGPLRDWKASNRQKALHALDAHQSTSREPVWGEKSKFRRDDCPWFIMAGRDDPRQKGYDVAAAAVEDYLRECHGKPDCAQFLFFPIPGDEDLVGVSFLRKLAERYPEDILVFPFMWRAGFMGALQGATYGLMPSLYEPFGMANEFYLAGGCAGIGRATGGNLQQIIPLRATAACSWAVRIRADRYHSLSAEPTGILFREKDGIASALRDWMGINEAKYDMTGDSPSRVEQRRGYAVFHSMASEMRVAIEDGIRVYRQEPELYFRMVAAGVAHIQRTFSWQRAGQEYGRKVDTQEAVVSRQVPVALEVLRSVCHAAQAISSDSVDVKSIQ